MTKVNKNLITIIVAGIVTATSILSITQANAFERGKKGHRGGQAFERIDADESGFLILDEILTPMLNKAESKIDRKDSDEDGVISFDEFNQTRDGTKTDLSEIADEIVQCVSDTKDETADENIEIPSADKFSSPEDKFLAIDTSGDGFIDLTELEAKITSKATTSFTEMDTDLDDQISEEEYEANKAIHSATGQAIRSCIEELTEEDVI